MVFASFVQLWPYNMTLKLRNYDFDVQVGCAPLWTSIWMSILTAVIGVVMVVIAAYVIQKFANTLTRFLYFLSILPAGVPGTRCEKGLSYPYEPQIDGPKTLSSLGQKCLGFCGRCGFQERRANPTDKVPHAAS